MKTYEYKIADLKFFYTYVQEIKKEHDEMCIPIQIVGAYTKSKKENKDVLDYLSSAVNLPTISGYLNYLGLKGWEMVGFEENKYLFKKERVNDNTEN